MKSYTSLLICCLFLCAVANAEGRIGFTLGASQREYGSSGAHAPDHNGIRWNHNGWIITENYDPEGLCTKVIYTGDWGKSPDRLIFSFLRLNTPDGVVWKQDQFSGPMGRKWHSSDYTTNGLILIHLIAEFEPNLAQGTVVITEYSLLIAVSN